MSSTSVATPWSARSEGLRHRLRILTVIAGSEFKLKYAGSVFGYAWSVIKPLALFTVLYLVFARVFKLGSISDYYARVPADRDRAVRVLLGRHLARHDVARRPGVSPAQAGVPASRDPDGGDDHGRRSRSSSTPSSSPASSRGSRITPRLDWLLVIPLLVELYVLHARPRADPRRRSSSGSATWARSGSSRLQLLFYASPIIYPIGFLPPFARDLVFLNPFTQVLQDIRALVLYPDLPGNTITAAEAFETFGRLHPDRDRRRRRSSSACSLFRREEPWFAERV